jgi:3-oxoacyl-[acyl-carrier protein] reductase
MKIKNILVTGSSYGIGFEIAKTLSKLKNCKIYLNGRKKKSLIKAHNSILNSEYILADITKSNGIKKLDNKIKNLDVLVCNVGSGKSVKPGQEKLSDWTRSLDQNFYTTVNTVKFFEKKLIKSKGIIICISSICGLEYIPGAPITYSVSKSALNTFVKCYSRILGPKGVRLNAIAPGNIFFKGSIWEKKLNKNKNYVKEMLNKNVSLKKLGSADDISEAVEFLVKSKSKFINGSIFVIDGGQIRSF